MSDKIKIANYCDDYFLEDYIRDYSAELNDPNNVSIAVSASNVKKRLIIPLGYLANHIWEDTILQHIMKFMITSDDRTEFFDTLSPEVVHAISTKPQNVFVLLSSYSYKLEVVNDLIVITISKEIRNGFKRVEISETDGKCIPYHAFVSASLEEPQKYFDELLIIQDFLRYEVGSFDQDTVSYFCIKHEAELNDPGIVAFFRKTTCEGNNDKTPIGYYATHSWNETILKDIVKICKLDKEGPCEFSDTLTPEIKEFIKSGGNVLLRITEFYCRVVILDDGVVIMLSKEDREMFQRGYYNVDNDQLDVMLSELKRPLSETSIQSSLWYTFNIKSCLDIELKR